MHYRPEIDGLRAIAVLAVVLFHARYDPFSGGFVGVDVFFVISGYLITSIIVAEIRRGDFSLARFYERRVRRIFPALFLTMSATWVVACFLLTPDSFMQFSRSIVAATLFSSNILFWRELGYFDVPAEAKPLLHTWSLSVEEQFYILYPVLLLILYKRLNKRWTAALAAVAALSFVASAWAVEFRSTDAFFWAPTRAWELLLGAFLAFDILPALRFRPFRELLSLAGVILIAWCVVSYTPETPFPGMNAFPPCFGAALVLYACGGKRDAVVGRILSSRGLVFVGLISYSLYLWHWPVFTFARLYLWRGLTRLDTLALIGLSVLLSVASWRFVEQRFRKRSVTPGRSSALLWAAGVIYAFTMLGVFGHSSGGWPSRSPTFAKYAFYLNHRVDCYADDPAALCFHGDPSRPRFALWGDSHAGLIAPAVAEVMGRNGFGLRQYTASACVPIPGIIRDGDDDECLKNNQAVLKAILADESVVGVVLAARWSLLIAGALDGDPIDRTYEVASLDGGPIGKSDQEQLYADRFRALISRLTNAGKRILLLYPVPEPGIQVRAILTIEALYGGDPDAVRSSFEAYDRRHMFIFNLFDDLPPSPLITKIYPHRALCNAADCAVSKQGETLYADYQHLSERGAKIVAGLLDAPLRRLETTLAKPPPASESRLNSRLSGAPRARPRASTWRTASSP